MSKRKVIVYILLIFVSQIAMSQYSENDWNNRDKWMDVNDIFDRSGVKKGSFVADIGCHEGYLTVHLAKRVGNTGKVFGVDVREDRLDRLKDNLDDRNITNVNIIVGDYDNPKLPTSSLDIVFIIDTYHEMDNYMQILHHVHNALKSNGKIVIIEKLKERIKGKSRAAQVSAHSLESTYVKKELLKTGFTIIHQDNNIGDWEDDSSKVMWMLIASKK